MIIQQLATETNPIEELAARLQRLPSSIRWLYSQEDLIQAAAGRYAPERGPRAKCADRLVLLTSYLGLGRICAAVVNLVLLIGAYARQGFAPAEHDPLRALFIGIGALREPALVARFEEMQARPVVRLDERGFADFFRHGRVPFLALVREMLAVWREVWQELHPSQPFRGIEKRYLLSFLLMRGHKFAYLRAWLRTYLGQPGASSVVACSAASYVSYAPVAAGAKTIYMLHGFQRHSLVYPDFARSICFTGFEAAHMQRRLPHCTVSVAAEPMRHVETRRVAAVAGIYWESDGFDLIRPFMEWALRNDLPVVVRIYPGMDTSGYWEQWRGTPNVEITEGEGSFSEFLEKVRPRFLASWYSTALFEAMVMGIVPVTVTPDNREALDAVFPFRELSLCWPEHEDLAQSLIDNDHLRDEFLARSYARAMAPAETGTTADMLRGRLAAQG